LATTDSNSKTYLAKRKVETLHLVPSNVVTGKISQALEVEVIPQEALNPDHLYDLERG